MNLLLIDNNDLLSASTLKIPRQDPRAQHLSETINVSVGDELRLGKLNDDIGSGVVTAINDQHIEIRITLDSPPPPALGISLVLALPRPKALRRILRSCTEVGVKEIHLINSWRVEKSYWQSPYLQRDRLDEQLKLGLAQCKDTVMPDIHFAKRFRPFVEDQLPGLLQNRHGTVLHPYAHEAQHSPLQTGSNTEQLICIGPEGGFIDYEVEQLISAGCKPLSLGPRILRVESCVMWALARVSAAVTPPS